MPDLQFALPLWAVFGLSIAAITTFVPLIQEKYKADPFPIVIWMKVFTISFGAPFLFIYPLPTEFLFYLGCFVSASLWAVADIAYFKAVPKVGAGIVTRIVPATVIITFIVWTIIDSATRTKYLSDPTQALLIFAVIILSAFFAFRMTKCPISWQGVRLLWFVLFAVAVGPIFDKLSIGAGATKAAPYAFMVVQGSFMMLLWGLYNLKARAFMLKDLITPIALKAGISIGIIAGITMIMRTQAINIVENPAYLTVLLFTDALWVVLIYKVIGRKEDSDVFSGLGIVFCAIALILLKSFSFH